MESCKTYRQLQPEERFFIGKRPAIPSPDSRRVSAGSFCELVRHEDGVSQQEVPHAYEPRSVPTRPVDG
jgi:hypothetical protein